ncbi:hypothetical protein U9M48_043589 [Paspalum notatum var. saurae]|uniref:Uncharacterized protein n=1 Tax=Paspalum notatum var. saurae TaxID=547442 RepID=A0AAQ3XHI4_PASNO
MHRASLAGRRRDLPPVLRRAFASVHRGLCDELNSMIGRYWWSQQDKVNKIHWLAWELLTRSKKKRRFGLS